MLSDSCIASGYGGAAVASPVRSATTPLSSYQSGLVSRPNPLDSSGNLVVTGNVGAGKHFRGPMPYRSTTSMNVPLGSTSLDSFMRYTAAPATPRSAAGTYGAFYSPTGTVTSTLPGTRSVSTEAVSTALPAAPRLQLWPGSTPIPAEEGMPKGFGEPLTGGYLSPPRTETVTGGDYKQQMEALQQRLGAVQSELSALEQSLAAETVSGTFFQQMLESDIAAPGKKVPETLGSPGSRSRKDELLQETARLLSATMGQPAPGVTQENTTPLDANGDNASITSTSTETRLRLYRPDAGLPQVQRLPEQSGFGAAPITPRVEARSHAFDTPGAFLNRSATDRPASETPRAISTEAVGVAHPTATAETIVVQPSVQGPAWKLDKEKTASSLKAFERHLKTARQHAQRGRYVQAASAFTLASAYRPNDPESYLGKSHALLAAGEYIGSALALAKAVELDAQYALQKSDLIWIAGGPDAFIARFNALDEALQAGATGHLQFLIAYIYHQMDRPEEAKVAIDAAKAAMPSSIAVNLLKIAIDR